MPVGSPVIAARGGVVILAVESHFDGEIAFAGKDNYLLILHGDGTVAMYGHLTHDGVVVDSGATVSAGQLVALSGNTGNTGNKPHLHLSVFGCDVVRLGSAACGHTVPFNFRNTEPNPLGLVRYQTYVAR